MLLTPPYPLGYFVFPGETGWELWGPGTDKSAKQGATATEMASSVPVREAVTVAIPVLHLNTLSTILPELPKSELLHAAALEAERLGLFEGRPVDECVWDWRILPVEIANSTASRLTTLCSLPRQLPADLEITRADHFVPSFEFYTLRTDVLTIWKELGRLVAVATRKGAVIHSQILTDSSLTKTVLQELRCMYFQLEISQLVPETLSIELRGDYLPEEVLDLRRYMALPVTISPRTAPRIPHKSLKLMPTAVTVGRKTVQTRRQRVRLFFTAILVVSAAIVLWGWWLNSLQKELRELQALADEAAPTAAIARGTAEKWDALDSVIDSRRSPLATLLNIVHCLPENRVRLLSFEQIGRMVKLEGEAKTSKDWSEFTVALKGAETLKEISWKTPSAVIDGQSKATFEVTGILNYAPLD
ncbi:MAG TPA: hypothetical protein VK970_23185 [Candidatus Methylacidiphilales bacterium]|nr:hypothetical protein [Candidatus Methylacidiphilales bacterium]